MDVKTVCLGMLTDGDASGYDLKKTFESYFGHCFAAGYGSIYPALASLAEDGLVSCLEIPQDGKPDRKEYCITAAGRQHLLKALANPAPSHKVRSEFLATMAFAHLMTPEQIETVLDSRIDDAVRNLQLIDDFEKCCDGDMPAGVQFSLGFGRAMMQAMKSYVEENRHLLETTADAADKAVTG